MGKKLKKTPQKLILIFYILKKKYFQPIFQIITQPVKK